jgi:hypothetical protein
MNVTYAIVFKPFYYDRDVDRHLGRLVGRTKDGHLYVVVDQTRQKVGEFSHGYRVNMTETDLAEKGYAAFPQGRVFWYNADYPLYHLHDFVPDYDYYVMVEYDAVVFCDLDALVRAAAATRTDLVAQRVETPAADWRWTESCRDAFPQGGVDPRMLCFAVFSRRAVMALKATRLAQSADWRRGAMQQWPIAEGFVGSELRRHGMRVRDLHQFGKLSQYDVWPPVHPWQLPFLRDQAVVHPVLTGKRYMRAMLRNGVGAAVRAQLGLLSDANMAYRHVWTARGGAARAANEAEAASARAAPSSRVGSEP